MKDTELSGCSTQSSETETSFSQSPISTWIIPQGARPTIETLVASELFQRAVENVNLSTAACRKRKSELLSLIQSHPGICHRKFEAHPNSTKSYDMFPLAIVCILEPSLTLVKAAYDANPNAISDVDPSTGSLPLHFACRCNASLDVIAFLVAKHPASVQITQKNGRIPFSVALHHKADGKVIEHLAATMNQEAKTIFFEESPFALHVAVWDQEPLLVVESLHRLKPDEILAPGLNSLTPLHLACHKRGNDDVVAYLLKHGPEAVEMELQDGTNCFVLAARSQSPSVLEILLPDDVPLEGVGPTLLDIACAHNDKAAVQYLLKRYPQLLHHNYGGGAKLTPLHIAAACLAFVENVKVLVQHIPEALLVDSDPGGIPLKLAKDSDAGAGFGRNASQLLAFLTRETSRAQKKKRKKNKKM